MVTIIVGKKNGDGSTTCDITTSCSGADEPKRIQFETENLIPNLPKYVYIHNFFKENPHSSHFCFHQYFYQFYLELSWVLKRVKDFCVFRKHNCDGIKRYILSFLLKVGKNITFNLQRKFLRIKRRSYIINSYR